MIKDGPPGYIYRSNGPTKFLFLSPHRVPSGVTTTNRLDLASGSTPVSVRATEGSCAKRPRPKGAPPTRVEKGGRGRCLRITPDLCNALAGVEAMLRASRLIGLGRGGPNQPRRLRIHGRISAPRGRMESSRTISSAISFLISLGLTVGHLRWVGTIGRAIYLSMRVTEVQIEGLSGRRLLDSATDQRFDEPRRDYCG